MKKFLLSIAAATTVLAAPVAANAADRNHNDDRGRAEQRYDRHDQKSRTQTQRYQTRASTYRQGERFDSRYATNYRVISNPRAYGLRDAPRGQQWVQSGNDALLVGIVGGLIGAVLGNAF